MRKFLSILLAVLMVASVSVISFSAADTEVQTATVTLKNIFGETVTETYVVGETITAYTYLNASEINEGKIGSIHGKQFYSHDVLELVAEYTDTEGITSDITAMFPVTKDNTMASGHWTTSQEYPDKGAVYYNASIASLGGFKFNADDAALIVVTYKVKAAGNAEIINEMVTLAASDRDLTRIIEDGVLEKSNFTMPLALSEPVTPVPTGSTVSGNITSYETTKTASDTVTLTLTGTDNNFTETTTGTTAYSFSNVPNGTYTLTVAKDNHATRTYDVTVSGELAQNVEINPLGDADLDGSVKANDALLPYQYSAGTASALTGYALDCADADGDGEIKANDALLIYQQSTGNNVVWTV